MHNKANVLSLKTLFLYTRHVHIVLNVIHSIARLYEIVLCCKDNQHMCISSCLDVRERKKMTGQVNNF